MGRTAESYLKEAATKPIEMLFPFVEWTHERLWERANYLQEQTLSGEREAQRAREIGHIAFELAARINEG